MVFKELIDFCIIPFFFNMKGELQSSWQGPRNVINMEGQIFSCPQVLPPPAHGRCSEGRAGRKGMMVRREREKELWDTR